MEIIWRRTALNHLDAIREFIAEDNPDALPAYAPLSRGRLVRLPSTRISEEPGGSKVRAN